MASSTMQHRTDRSSTRALRPSGFSARTSAFLAVCRSRLTWSLIGSSLVIGCSASDPPAPTPVAGASSGGSQNVAGSTPSPGGSPAASGGSGVAGSSVAGVAGVAGSNVSGSAGAPSTLGGSGGTAGLGSGGGSGGSAAGQGGTAAGGMAGMSSGGGGRGGSMGMGAAGGMGGSGGMNSGGKAAVERSAGCNKPNPQTGSASSPLMVSNHQYYVKLPTNYDATKAYPVLFVFNPTNNPIDWAERSAGFESTDAKSTMIRVYPHPQNPSSGWGAGDVSFFQPLYDQITNNFCVDKARAFAAGESSGGDFSSILGCEHANKLRAIGPCATKPVQGYALDASKRDCTGQVTAVVIHGVRDNVVGTANGPLTRDFYRTLNGCGTMTMPVTGFTDQNSNCVQYQGCDAGYPVYWCSHAEATYNNTNHGWPTFASKMLWQVFSSY